MNKTYWRRDCDGWSRRSGTDKPHQTWGRLQVEWKSRWRYRAENRQWGSAERELMGEGGVMGKEMKEMMKTERLWNSVPHQMDACAGVRGRELHMAPQHLTSRMKSSLKYERRKEKKKTSLMGSTRVWLLDALTSWWQDEVTPVPKVQALPAVLYVCIYVVMFYVRLDQSSEIISAILLWPLSHFIITVLELICWACRQPGGAAEFEATCPGAGGWKRRPQINSSSSDCGAESVPNLFQTTVQTGGTAICKTPPLLSE